jgi:cyanophycinase-like exopeptidase
VNLTVRLTTPITTLALIGGGEFSFGETRAIDERLLSSMPRERRTVAFVPTASGSNEYAQHIGRYFRDIDPSVQTVNVPLYRGRDVRRQKNLNMILEAGMIYFGGGVASTLLGVLRQSPAEMAIREAAANGTVVAAIGVSASCFGTAIHDPRSGAAVPGFGWMEATAVEAGFDPAHDTALRRLMSSREIEVGIGLPVSTALFARSDGSAEVEGQGQVAVFRKPSGMA